jgi:hypothetical protein
VEKDGYFPRQKMVVKNARLIYTILVSADKQEDIDYPLPTPPRQ